ncbi:hypothetical protein BYT27DRAFT_7187347 [Phlegmacium glaucopus]|nr:hypothetical protein BYT27DRAFT_7187347 [Phlegmacium glaucopus]
MSHSIRKFEEISNRIAPPSHRHAAPSAPWPWIDTQDEVNRVQLESSELPVPSLCDHQTCNDCWKGYPQSLFPNWTPAQVKKSKISIAIKHYRRNDPCIIHHVDVDENGYFRDADRYFTTEATIKEAWTRIVGTRVPDNIRVRAFFVENLSGPILQMLGTKYKIEPFFFSSSLNWIPSRFQEEVRPGLGDHITITLTFLRSVGNTDESVHSNAVIPTSSPPSPIVQSLNHTSHLVHEMIDTHTPLVLASSGRQLVLDLLSVHLLRKAKGSVIISYHPTKDIPITTAQYLHQRIRFAGQSVYWQSMFQKSPDPTFVLLTFIWHTIYAWDEALEALYNHICIIEGKVVATTDFNLTQELHVIRAHLLHYSSLLEDLRKTVDFVQTTPNPALDSLTPEELGPSRTLLERECDNILSEVDRLEKERSMQERRLSNVMNLVFSSLNILDSKQMQKMTEASMRDNTGMKQIAYLSMVFLPASFVANIFGMNIQEIVPGTKGSIAHYVVTTIAFTLVTVWVITAFQSRYIFRTGVTFWKRLGWPVFLLLRLFGKDPYAPTTADPSQGNMSMELKKLN